MELEPDVENMTLNEYLDYEAKKERRSWRNVRSKNSQTSYEGADFNSSQRDTSITLDFPHYYEDAFIDKYKKDSHLNEILDDLFRLGAENLRRMDVELEKEEAQVEDDDDGDTYDIWDITVEDVERIGNFLTPNVPDEMDKVIQPLIPQPIHTTPPNDDYVAPATKSILDELLEEFGDEILNVTMVDEEADFNPTKDIEELERILAKDPQSHFTKIQVHTIITKLEPFIHTQQMSPLYGIFESYKSSTEPYKVDREMKSPSRTSSNTREPRCPSSKTGMVLFRKYRGEVEHKTRIKGQGNNARGAGAASYGGAQNRVGNANPEYFKYKMLLMQAQENIVALDEEQLLFITGGQDNVVDDRMCPTTQDYCSMENLLIQHDPVVMKPGWLFDEHYEVHEMHDDVQPNYVVDSHANYTSDSNMILYDQYVKDNAVPVVQSNVSLHYPK
ncbi:hypothetical protein Tco_1409363 [Tanacetum coccineum]